MGRNFSFVTALAALALVAAAGAGSASAQTPADAPGLIAPPSVCANQDRLGAPPRALRQAMRCMTDFARRRAGLGAVASASALDSSARGKARDILRCDDFSHFACGRDFKHWMQRSGYISTPCWRVGENLAWGERRHGTARAIFRAWMASPSHRENILGDFAELGVSVRAGSLEGRPGTRVWAQHFGTHCGGSDQTPR